MKKTLNYFLFTNYIKYSSYMFSVIINKLYLASVAGKSEFSAIKMKE